MKDSSGRLIEQGDVYYVNFDPSVGSEIRKKRPALVVQDHRVAGMSRTVFVCPITSSERVHPFDVPMDEHFLAQGSRVRVIQPTTCDVVRFGKYLGKVNRTTWKGVLDALLMLIGI